MTKIFALLDKKANKFLATMERTNDAVFIREMQDAINAEEKTMLSKYSEDFDLYSLATFNPETGEVVSDFRLICNAKELKNVNYL